MSTPTSTLDRDLADFLPYYYQLANQLGYPIDDESYLQDLLQYPYQDLPPAYIPSDIAVPPYDTHSMVDIQDWLSASGASVMLVYGQDDPWSAAALELGGAVDSFLYFVPGGNHGSSVGGLPNDQRAEAETTIARWAGLSGARLLLPGAEPEAAPPRHRRGP